MIDFIEIKIQNNLSNFLDVLIINSKNICYKNNKKYNVTDEFLKDIISTICLWKNEYGSDSKIDSEEFTITVKTDIKEEKFHGKGIFPNNYEHLKELLVMLND